MSLSAEIISDITHAVKAKMRDTVFEEIIKLAKHKGSLTVDKLVLMFESAKIMEKLRDKNDL